MVSNSCRVMCILNTKTTQRADAGEDAITRSPTLANINIHEILIHIFQVIIDWLYFNYKRK